MAKRIILILLAVVSISFAGTTPELGIHDKTPTVKAFVNARIVQSPARTIENGTMVVADGRIVAIGGSVTVPGGATVFDLAGKTIYPAFIDPVTEYGVPNAERPRRRWGEAPRYEAERAGADAWNDALHPELNWVDEFQPDSKEADELLALGFATVQSARLDGILRGRSTVVTLGEGLPNDLILKAYGRQFGSFDKGSSEQQYPSSQMGAIALIRQTLLDTDWYDKAQSAYSRNPAQKAPETNRALEAMQGVRTDGMVFETANALEILRADRIGREFSVPMIMIGGGNEYTRLAAIKQSGVDLILPLEFPETPAVKDIGDEYDVTLGQLRHWEWAPFNAYLLDSAGIEFAFTTHGLKNTKDFWKNLRTAISCGLPAQTALAALTSVPARIAGVDDQVGTLEQNKLASFVLTDGDLFDEKTHIYSVWVAGEKRHEEIKLDQVDFRGNYTLQIDHRAVTLKLTGDITKLSGKIEIDSATSMTLTDISIAPDVIAFSAVLDSLGMDGTTRFEARRSENGLVGFYVSADGGKHQWSAERIETAADEKKKKTPEEEPPSRISRLTSPNIAYGFETPPTQQSVLITNATIWTSDEAGVLENADLLVQDGKIRAIGSDLEAPSGVLTIDASGMHVTPGIIDEHSHIAIAGDVNEGTHAVTAEVRIGDIVDPEDIAIYRELAGGTTAAQLLHGSANPIGGQAQVVKLRWGAGPEAMKMPEAPNGIKFALGENVKQSNWGERYTVRYPQTRMGVETIIRDAFQTAREYEQAHEQFGKLGKGDRERTIPPRQDLLMDALVEVLNSNMFVHCHAYVQSEMLMLMRLAEDFGFRLASFEHVLEGYKIADEMAAHGVGGGSFADWWAYKFEVYDAIPYSPALMSERGVLVSINSDSPEQGRRLNQEAAKSIMYGGMSPEEALKMVTINPARQLGIDRYTGSLAVGKDADFVIWSDNPLSMYAVAQQTWIDGRKYFDIENDHKMRETLSQEKSELVQKVLKTGESSGRKDRGGPGGPKPYSGQYDDAFDLWIGAGEGGYYHD
ncbi:amidohydrolase family protein [bacterium]|nr:amidohydrolase family protein [bacterium]